MYYDCNRRKGAFYKVFIIIRKSYRNVILSNHNKFMTLQYNMILVGKYSFVVAF